jgi:hypothetical protein
MPQRTQLEGRCHCGNVTLKLTLSDRAATMTPRACDCSFCQMHGAAYVSDPHGSLDIHVSRAEELGRYRQGSESADMLICKQCGGLIGASVEQGGHTYATVNVRMLGEIGKFGTTKSVSPQRLNAADKIARWRELWFSKVTISGG